MTTNFLHVTELCKDDNTNCGQEDWSIRACNYLATLTDSDNRYVKERDISLCANTYIVNGTLDSTVTSYNVENPNNNYFIANQLPFEQTQLNAWTKVQTFERAFNQIIMKLDNTYDSSHNHAQNADNPPRLDYFHTHQDDDPTKPVNFSNPNTGSMVTPHTHNTTDASYPLVGINRSNLVDENGSDNEINMFENAPDATNWSFIQNHWETINISDTDTPITIENAISELKRIIAQIENMTTDIKDNYNSSSKDVGCESEDNLGKATSSGTCITNDHLRSKCKDETTGQWGSCSSLKIKENKKYQTNLNSSHAAKLSAKNQTMLYNINVSACVNLVIGILLLSFIIFKLFKLPSPTKKMGEVASKVSDGAKKTANSAKKNVGKAANVAKDGAAVAAKKTAETAKKGMAQIDNLTNAAKASPKPNLKK